MELSNNPSYSITPYLNLPGAIQGSIFLYAGLKTFVDLRQCSNSLRLKIDHSEAVWRAFCEHLKLGYSPSDTKNWKELLISQMLQNRNMRLANQELLACRINNMNILCIERKIYKVEPGKLTCIDDHEDKIPDTIEIPMDETYVRDFENNYFITSTPPSKIERDCVYLKSHQQLTVWKNRKAIIKSTAGGRYQIKDDRLIRLARKPAFYKDFAEQTDLEIHNLNNLSDKHTLVVPSDTRYIGQVAELVLTYIQAEGLMFYDLNNRGKSSFYPFPSDFRTSPKCTSNIQYNNDYLTISDQDSTYWWCAIKNPVFHLFGLSISTIPLLARNCFYTQDAGCINCFNFAENITKKFPVDGLFRDMKICGDRLVVSLENKICVYDTDTTNQLYSLELSLHQSFSVQSGILYVSHFQGFSFWNLATGQKIGENTHGFGVVGFGAVSVYQKSTLYNYMRAKPLKNAPPPVSYTRSTVPQITLSLSDRSRAAFWNLFTK